MSWPLNSRDIPFLSRVTTITADFLNSVQDVIIGIYGGTKTLVSLQVDGSGNNTATAAAGTIVASGNIIAANSVVGKQLEESGGAALANGNIVAITAGVDACSSTSGSNNGGTTVVNANAGFAGGVLVLTLTFTGSGFTGTPKGLASYVPQGAIVTPYSVEILGTSNAAASIKLYGLPAGAGSYRISWVCF